MSNEPPDPFSNDADATRGVATSFYREDEEVSREVLLEGEPRYDNGHDLVHRDGYLYVSAQNDARFGILKVNDSRVLELTKRVR